MEKICGVCNQSFQVRPYLAEAKKYCSPACKHLANRVSLQCAKCGKEFWTWKSQIEYGHGKYCSKVCMVTAKKAVPKPKRIYVPIFKSCEVCGASFCIPPSRKDTARFCSRACQKLSPEFKIECSEREQGDKSWRWAGGIYQFKTGYVRLKRRRNGKETVRFEHTDVMINWMLEVESDHPFLVDVEGRKRLHPDIEVHHIDRVRSNNARENLLAVTKDAHAKIHHRGKKPDPWECWPSHPEKW